jgi:hypothetical protein
VVFFWGPQGYFFSGLKYLVYILKRNTRLILYQIYKPGIRLTPKIGAIKIPGLYFHSPYFKGVNLINPRYIYI